jgi:hypothetical protein
MLTKCMGILFVTLVVAQAANSAAVELENGHAIGIEMLDVQGVLYDVSFQNNYYVLIWGYTASTFGFLCSEPGGAQNPHPCGPGDPTAASEATGAINSLLNTAGITSIKFDDGSIQESYVIPYLFDISVDTGTQGSFDGATWRQIENTGSGTPELRPYAVFTRSIPIPAAAYLFASGLGLLGWFRRRQTA